jgi:heat shock protein HtpX
MKALKRWGLFFLTNILVVTTISIILNILHVNSYLSKIGVPHSSLLLICFVWGMTGAFISLLLSKIIAKSSYGVRILRPDSVIPWEKNLVAMVGRLSARANLKCPEVGVYEGAEVNAFATGPTKNRSLVAVSSGLLDNMDLDQLEGVLAHEVAHIANGDMVTMTLVQGIVNSFALFLSRLLANVIVNTFGGRDRDTRGLFHFVVVQVLDIVLTLLGSILVCWFSRYREYRADEGAVKLSSKFKIVSALEFLRQNYEVNREYTAQTPQNMSAFKISGIRSKGLMYLFSTHPTLTSRIERIQDLK